MKNVDGELIPNLSERNLELKEHNPQYGPPTKNLRMSPSLFMGHLQILIQ